MCVLFSRHVRRIILTRMKREPVLLYTLSIIRYERLTRYTGAPRVPFLYRTGALQQSGLLDHASDVLSEPKPLRSGELSVNATYMPGRLARYVRHRVRFRAAHT